MKLPDTAEIVIIGGGIIGTACAYFLAEKGREVVLLEKNDLAAGASGACDEGIILSSKNPGIHLTLARKSKKIYQKINRRFEEDLEFQESGGMILIEEESQLSILKDFVFRKKEEGLDISLIKRKKIKELQPYLESNLVGAVYCKEDSQINPLNTTLAFASHAQKQGASIFRNTSVEDIDIKKGEIRAVKTKKGKIAVEKVINTAGAWAPKISKMAGIDIPIKPRRGQLLVSEEMPELIKGTLLDAKYITSKYSTKPENEKGEMSVGLSLTQTQAGNLLIGGCRHFSGYNKRTSYYAFQAIMKNAVKMIPFLKEINIIRSFAGLRPYTPDGKPILGKVPGIKGLYIAAGHEGDGIALAPVTGKIISKIIAGEATGIKPEIFRENLSLKRFISGLHTKR